MRVPPYFGVPAASAHCVAAEQRTAKTVFVAYSVGLVKKPAYCATP